LLVLLRTQGIGAAIVTGDRLYRGAFGMAGEFGHVLNFRTSLNDASTCRCGNTGCVETVSTPAAILRRLREKDKENQLESVSWEKALRRVTEDSQAAQAFREAGESFGLEIAALINILDPAQVYLYGVSDLLQPERASILNSSATELFMTSLDNAMSSAVFPSARCVRSEQGQDTIEKMRQIYDLPSNEEMAVAAIVGLVDNAISKHASDFASVA
jgi:predicted NBD/HSP70 family sugar kinase